MNVAGPSRRRVATVESIYEQDLLALLDQLSPDDLDEMQTAFTNRTGAGEGLSDHDVAMNDLLQQARALAVLDDDRVLAERIADGGNEFGLEFQGPPIVEAPCVAVPRPTWRRKWGLVSRISRRLSVRPRRAARQNQNEQPARDDVVPSETQGGRLASVIGRVLGSQLASQSGLADSDITASRTVNRPTGHDCVICQDPIYGVDIRAPCGHYYDIDCITSLFQSAIKDETLYPPRCCRQNIPYSRVRPHLPRALITTLREKDAELNTLNRVYCSSPTCNRFLGPLSKGIFASKVYTCPAPHCGRRTCGKCREQHTGGWRHVCRPDADTAEVLELSRTSGWARCPGCSQMIELNMGCYHMTCRCRTEFCYLCRARWKKCKCPQWDERRLLEVAEERVLARHGEGQERAAARHVAAQQARPAPAPAPVLAASDLRRRERVARRNATTRRIPPLRPPTPTTPIRTPATRSTSVSTPVASSSSSPSPPSASFAATSAYSGGHIRWPDLRRQALIYETMKVLRVDHECAHAQWCYREGGGVCQHCGDYLPKYLFRCEGCETLACNRCRRNRL